MFPFHLTKQKIQAMDGWTNKEYYIEHENDHVGTYLKQRSSTLENRLPPIPRNMVTEFPPIPSKPDNT